MPKNSPLVSIVIPVYNGADFVEEAIESALTQTYRSIEVIVIDDGSTDDGKTREILERYKSDVSLFVKPNGGCASALNLGISQMKGSYFSWLSHDDIYAPSKIERQLQLLDVYGEDAIVYSNIRIIDALGEVLSETRHDQTFKRDALEDPFVPLALSLINGCSLLITKELISSGFEEKYITTQDYHKWREILPKTKILFCPEALVYSRSHSNQDSLTNPRHTKEADEYWEIFFGQVIQSEYLSKVLSTDEMVMLAKWHLKHSGYMDTKKSIEFHLRKIYETRKETHLTYRDWESNQINGVVKKISLLDK